MSSVSDQSHTALLRLLLFCSLQDSSGSVPKEDLKRVFIDLFPSLSKWVYTQTGGLRERDRQSDRQWFVNVVLCAGTCWRRSSVMSSELQTEPSVEVRPQACCQSADPSGHKLSRRNTHLFLVSFTAVDFQLFLGLYKRLYADCRTVVRLSFLHTVFKVCGLLWMNE